MSTSGKRPGLNHPAVIAVVVVLLAAVAALNVRTFGSRPERSRRAGEVAVEADLPLDLDQILARSGSAALAQPHAGWGDAPGMARDPFSKAPAAAPRPATKPAAAAKSATRSTRRDGGPVCSAVMLGGRRPLALIDEATVGISDKVGAWHVIAIDAGGARLRNEQGRELFLPVGGEETREPNYRVVTGADGR